MDRAQIKDKVEVILIEILQHSRFVITEELTAADVDGWDSLTHMMIISKIETEFNIKFKLKELNKLNNMGNLLDLIASKL